MKNLSFFLFLGIILTIYCLAHLYLWNKANYFFSGNENWNKAFKTVIIVGSFSFFIGEILEHTISSLPGEQIYRIGAFWIAFLLYLTIGFLIVDIARLVNFIIPFSEYLGNIIGYKEIGGKMILCIALVVITAGYYNALHPRIKEINLYIDKPVNENSDLRILLATDIHLGALCGDLREQKLVKQIKSLQPDLVLFAGDIVDGDLGPVLRKKLGKHLNEIKTPLGIYTVPGNHEYIGGIKKTIPYLKSLGLKVLQDEVIILPMGIALVGREERESKRFNGHHRKPLSELLKNLDKQMPVIVMNHQPYPLQEAVDNNVDLHVSGHTHHGQMWPLNYITQSMFDLSWGLEKRGNTYLYVSSGYGTWGPPVRIGNRPEIVVFNLRFKNMDQPN